MRTDGFKGILLSILLTVSLIAPAITTITLLSVSLVSANPGPLENIIRASDTAYNRDGDPAPPWKWYGPDEDEQRPPVMVAKEVENGAVVAAGLARTANNSRWNDTDPVNTHPYLDNLFDKAFRWMTGKAPGATTVLWYGEYASEGTYEYVFNESTMCSMLITSLKGEGYTVENTINGTFTPITAGLLDPYDILVIPQLQLGDEGTGGDPTLLPDSVVATIETFVRTGGGLLIMDGSDFAQYNFANVQNKILRALDMGMYFQSDSIDDETNYWGGGTNYFQPLVDVDNTTWIGSAFENEMDGKTIGIYAASSLAPKGDYEISMAISPSYKSGFPNATIKYTVSVFAAGWENDNFNLSVDNVWSATLGTTRLENVGPDGKETTLAVTIPSGTAFGDEDEITVTATSQGDNTVSMPIKVKAIASMRIGPPMEDTYTTQQPLERGSPWNDPRGGWIWMHVGSDRDNNKRTYLKFDLSGIPEGLIPPDNVQIDDIQARLFLWCEVLPTSAAAGKNVDIYAVDNDDWNEMEMYWGENEPENGALLDTTKVDEAGYWYSWDVTSYVIEQFKTDPDNIASFSLRAETENLEGIDAFGYYSFSPTNATDTGKHPYLIIGYDVSTWISPDYDGLPGGTLTYNVNVWNKGSFADNYELDIENAWETTLENRILNVQPMEVRPATLTVKIPDIAPIGLYDNILVTVVSERSGENDNGTCIARASTHVSAWEDSSTKGSDESPHHSENSVWGRAGTIYVGRYLDGPERGWLKFDLRAFPAGTTVTRANLYLNCYETDGADVTAYSVGDDSWSEYTINWLNKPAIDNALDTRAVFENDKWYSWDVTDFVANQYAGDKIVSFCMVDVGETLAPDHDARFSSKEYEENWSYLEILATAPNTDVRALAKPIFRGGLVGDTLTYTITVVNKGDSVDNFDLSVEENEAWGSYLSENTLLNIASGDNDTTMLNVPVSGAVCTTNGITITVTSQENSKIYDNIRARAHRSKVWFVNKAGSGPDKLRTLYEVWLDLNFLLRDDASELVLKFYTWGGGSQGENVVSTTMPAHLRYEYPDVWKNPHPQGKAVEKVELILRDAQGTTIQTITTFIDTKTKLEIRFMEIPGEWFLASPAGRITLELEFSAIPGKWFLAPS